MEGCTLVCTLGCTLVCTLVCFERGILLIDSYSLCVVNLGLPRHLNFFKVRPRVCKTDRTQMAMAEDSLVDPGLDFTVFLTSLIQRQKRVTCFILL